MGPAGKACPRQTQRRGWPVRSIRRLTPRGGGNARQLETPSLPFAISGTVRPHDGQVGTGRSVPLAARQNGRRQAPIAVTSIAPCVDRGAFVYRMLTTQAARKGMRTRRGTFDRAIGASRDRDRGATIVRGRIIGILQRTGHGGHVWRMTLGPFLEEGDVLGRRGVSIFFRFARVAEIAFANACGLAHRRFDTILNEDMELDPDTF